MWPLHSLEPVYDVAYAIAFAVLALLPQSGGAVSCHHHS